MTQRPWVNDHHLHYFKAIAVEGGIAKAPKKLRLQHSPEGWLWCTWLARVYPPPSR